MIARIWTGAVRKADGDAYAEYMRETCVAGYARTPHEVAAAGPGVKESGADAV